MSPKGKKNGLYIPTKTEYLKRENCLFIATNTDSTYPITLEGLGDVLLPGAGTAVIALEKCSNRKAEVIGKPNKGLLEVIFFDHNIKDASRVCMVGDRLDTDIAISKHVEGMKSLLVFTGVCKRQDLLNSQIMPTHIAEALPLVLELQKYSK